MKCCARHNQALADAIKHRGLWHLVDLNPLVMKPKAVRWMAGTATPEDFDPYMVAIFEINQKAVEQCGSYITGKRADGEEYCPLCEVAYRMREPRVPEQWIDNLMDVLDLNAIKNGLRHATV